MTPLLAFAPLLRTQAWRLALALVLSVVTVLAGVLLLGVSGWYLTTAALATAGAGLVLAGPAALVRGLSVLRILSRYGEKLVGHDATLRLLAGIRAWLFGTLFPRVPLHDRTLRHGDLVSRLTADVEALDTAFLVALGPLSTTVIVGVLTSFALAWLVPAAGMVYAAAYLAALVLVPAILMTASRRTGRAIVEASAGLRIAILDALAGHDDLKALGGLDQARVEIEAWATRLATARRSLGRTAAIAGAAVQLLAGAALLGVLWHGLAALQQGRITAPWLVGAVLAALGGFEALALLVRSTARLGTAAAAAERLADLHATPPAILDPPVPRIAPGDRDLEFRGVVYGHEPARPVLRQLDLHVPAGSRVAVLGPSGSGKSTLLSLLLRLDDPDAGTVRLGGVDLRDLRQADLHRRVALLSQASPVFLGTIRDNLLIGRPDADDAALFAALAAARLDRFVAELPDGLDTELGEGGRTLSAGQARRLCLARTLLAPAGVIVMDEPTAGLDPEVERDFLADLAAATAGRTVLLATHAALPPGSVERTYRLIDGVLRGVDGDSAIPATAVSARRSTIST